MASLKETYKDKVKFYFVEYNQKDALPVIEKFNIQAHPETFILDKNDKLSFKMKGFDDVLKGKEQLTNEIEKALEIK